MFDKMSFSTFKRALLKMWLKVERSSLQFKKEKKTEISEALPFQSLFGWLMLSSGGGTKDLVRKTYFGILCTGLVL